MDGIQLHRGFKRLAIAMALMPLLVGGIIVIFLRVGSAQEIVRLGLGLVILSAGIYMLLRAVGSGLVVVLGAHPPANRREYIAGFLGFWVSHTGTVLLLRFIAGRPIEQVEPKDLVAIVFVPLVLAMVCLWLVMRTLTLKLFDQNSFMQAFSPMSLIRILAIVFAASWSCVGLLLAAQGLSLRDASIALKGLLTAVASPIAALVVARVIIWVLKGFEREVTPLTREDLYPSKRVTLIAILFGICLLLGAYRFSMGSFLAFPRCSEAIIAEAQNQAAAEKAWIAKVRAKFGDEFADSDVRLMSLSTCLNGRCRISARACIKPK
jgi:hypothetical protein